MGERQEKNGKNLGVREVKEMQDRKKRVFEIEGKGERE